MSFYKIITFILISIIMINSQSSELVVLEAHASPDHSESFGECTEKGMESDNIAMYEMIFTPTPINLLAVSPDSSFVASVTSDYTIEIWDSKTRTLHHTLTGLSEKICCLAIAPDNGYIVAGAANGLVKVWNLSGKLLYTLICHTDAVQAIAITEDSNYIVTGSKDATTLWNRWGKPLDISEKNGSEVKAISCTNNKIVTLTMWGSLKIWDREHKKTYTLNDFSNPITAFAISQDARFMVIGYINKKAFIQYSNELIPLVGHTQPISTIAISHDTTKIITGSADNTVKIWDTKTGNLLITLSDHTAEITKIIISKDDALLVSCSADNKAHIWQMNTGKLLYTFEIPVCAIALASDNSCYIATEPVAHVTKLS